MNQIPNVEEAIKALRPKLLPTTAEMDLYEREVIKLAHQQLQKAREEERERVKRFLSLREASPQTDFDSDEEYQLHRQKIGAINWYANLIKGQIDLPDLPETNY